VAGLEQRRERVEKAGTVGDGQRKGIDTEEGQAPVIEIAKIEPDASRGGGGNDHLAAEQPEGSEHRFEELAADAIEGHIHTFPLCKFLHRLPQIVFADVDISEQIEPGEAFPHRGLAAHGDELRVVGLAELQHGEPAPPCDPVTSSVSPTCSFAQRKRPW